MNHSAWSIQGPYNNLMELGIHKKHLERITLQEEHKALNNHNTTIAKMENEEQPPNRGYI